MGSRASAVLGETVAFSVDGHFLSLLDSTGDTGAVGVAQMFWGFERGSGEREAAVLTQVAKRRKLASHLEEILQMRRKHRKLGYRLFFFGGEA